MKTINIDVDRMVFGVTKRTSTSEPETELKPEVPQNTVEEEKGYDIPEMTNEKKYETYSKLILTEIKHMGYLFIGELAEVFFCNRVSYISQLLFLMGEDKAIRIVTENGLKEIVGYKTFDIYVSIFLVIRCILSTMKPYICITRDLLVRRLSKMKHKIFKLASKRDSIIMTSIIKKHRDYFKQFTDEQLFFFCYICKLAEYNDILLATEYGYIIDMNKIVENYNIYRSSVGRRINKFKFKITGEEMFFSDDYFEVIMYLEVYLPNFSIYRYAKIR